MQRLAHDSHGCPAIGSVQAGQLDRPGDIAVGVARLEVRVDEPLADDAVEHADGLQRPQRRALHGDADAKHRPLGIDFDDLGVDDAAPPSPASCRRCRRRR